MNIGRVRSFYNHHTCHGFSKPFGINGNCLSFITVPLPLELHRQCDWWEFKKNCWAMRLVSMKEMEVNPFPIVKVIHLEMLKRPATIWKLV
jgi:hypothetical protein